MSTPKKRHNPCGKRYGEAAKKEAKRLYKNGLTVAAICRLRGMSSNAKVVRGWLTDQGVEIRSEKTTIYPRRKILKQLQDGRLRKEIAAEYGCSMKFLSNLANGKIS